jgi:hypothetical protein
VKDANLGFCDEVMVKSESELDVTVPKNETASESYTAAF